MRNHLSRLGLSLVALTLPLAAEAAPPDEGYVGAIVYRDGREPERIACDTLDLVRIIYEAGKESVFRMHPKFKELAADQGTNGNPQCTVGTYADVRVLEQPLLLGPVDNPVGDAELFLWAIHVDNSPKGGSADYWILYLDTKTERPWLQVGRSI
ncbi:MAG TPA: hypothetical protein VFK86_02195 [Bauldia sp.]|nr:hypothetical protein [Bauldia sp.]